LLPLHFKIQGLCGSANQTKTVIRSYNIF
jgi:hypothetical protein